MFLKICLAAILLLKIRSANAQDEQNKDFSDDPSDGLVFGVGVCRRNIS